MHPNAWLRRSVAAIIVIGAVLGVAAPAQADRVTIPAAGSLPAIPGNLQRPSGPGPFPAVVILAGCEGLSPLETRTAAELVQQGYAALILDVLAAQGIKNACTAGAGTIATSARLAYVSFEWLATQPGIIPDHLGAVGFSMGAIELLGLVDPLTPHVPPPGLRAAVAYYPDCAQRRPDVSVPLQILDGDADDWTPAAPCAALAHAATAAGKVVQITTYPGATHAFNQQGPQRTYLGHTLRYDGTADKDADAKELLFLATYLK
jgi:dienelactone hydrolase